MIGLNLDKSPPQWDVIYLDINQEGMETWDMKFDVDASTGKILKADYIPFSEQLIKFP